MRWPSCVPSCVCGKFLRHSMNMQEEIHMSTDSLWILCECRGLFAAAAQQGGTFPHPASLPAEHPRGPPCPCATGLSRAGTRR
ncbi:Hypothetical protein ADP8_04237 [Roseomonas mucosa]|nr:Hypothetical protein ADP8_04237 [Roseomonas mucosa]